MQQLKILFFLLSIGLTTLINAQNEDIQFDISMQSFPGLELSAIDFGDIDGDGDEDFILTGSNGNSSNNAETYLYENQGNGFFVIVSGTPFDRVFEGDVEFADVDNDLDLDLILAGENNSGDYVLELYKNDGSGSFTHAPNSININCMAPSKLPNVRIAKLNSDQYVDMVYISNECQNVLLNDGTGTFNFSSTIDLAQYSLTRSNVKIGDLDNDGDNDFVTTYSVGSPVLANFIKVFKNNGNTGQFTEDPTNLIEAGGYAHIELVDTDFDNDLDLIIEFFVNNTIHYENISSPNNIEFSQHNQLSSYYSGGNLITLDINKDGYPDKISTGDSNDDSTYLYFMNPQTNSFDYNGPNYKSTITRKYIRSDLNYSDIDNDGDYDLLISGRYASNNNIITELYYNNSCPPVSYVDRRNLVCDSITWRGNHFNYGPPTESSESYYDTTYTVNGCDSAITFFPRFLSGMAQEVNPLHTFFDTGWVAVADNAVNVQWLDCNDNYAPVPGGNHLLFTPPSIGQYAITIDDGVCVDTSLCFNVYSLGTNSYLEENVKIYPNPSSGIFTVETPLAAFQYQVYNMVGQEVLSGQATQSSIRLNLAQFERGVYILNLAAEGGQRLSYRLVRE